MKTTLLPFPRFLAIILVAAILTTTTGFAPLNSASAQEAACGKWLVHIVNADKEKRITATLINESSGDNCRGAITMTNNTSLDWFGGGYIMEITTLADNANPIVSLSGGTESKFLMSSAPLDIRAIPINPTLPANVSVVGDITAKSFGLDAAFFLLKSGLALLPGSSLTACGIGDDGTHDEMIMAFITNNWLDILPGINRGSEVIANSVALTITGDFGGAKRELLGVLPQFFGSFESTLKKQAGKCAIGLILEILKKPTAPVLIASYFLTWVLTMGWDYSKYKGAPAKVEMIYTPVVEPTKRPPTPTPTSTPTPTNTPTPVSSLRGTVLEHSSCRYGPGAPYLYKYGLLVDTRMEIIGRDADGDWLNVQAIGGNNPCWIKASLMKVDGDVMRLPDAYPFSHLPISSYFERITILGVSSSGGTVTVEWLEHIVRPDLSTGEGVEYIVEVWTCVAGKPAFYAIGTNNTSASFQIDSSCGQSSHADVVGEDKHGFSLPGMIALP